MNKKAITLLKCFIALFVSYYVIKDISDILVGDVDYNLSILIYLFANAISFILAWSIALKETTKFKMLILLFFIILASSMSYYNEDISQKLELNDCIASEKSWDTIEMRCRYDCASWTASEGCVPVHVKSNFEEVVEVVE